MITPNIEALKAMDKFSSNYRWDWGTMNQIAGQIFTFKGEMSPEFKEACYELSDKMNSMKKEFDYIYASIEDLKVEVQ